MVAFGYATVHVFLTPPPTYAPEELTLVAGRIDRVDMEEVPEVWIEGQGLSFRGLLRHDAVEELQVGRSATIGFVRADERRDRWQRRDFREICSLEIDGKSIQSLDEYNRDQEQNVVVGRLFCPLAFLMSIGLWICLRRFRPMTKSEFVELQARAPTLGQFLPAGILLGVMLSILFGVNGWYGAGWAGEVAGPGLGGAALGIAESFGFGIGVALFLAAFSRAVRWCGQNRRRWALFVILTYPLSLALLYAVRPSLFIIGVVIAAALIGFLVRRVADTENATSESIRDERIDAIQ
jgi:hypothetical protein